MFYYSTNNKKVRFGLKEAILKGLAPDKGLFMPSSVPIISRSELESLHGTSLPHIALILSELLFGEDIPFKDLKEIVEEAICFDTPVVKLDDDLYTLELFHGPTFAFKDVGARFLARLLGYYTRDLKEDIHVLVATSGDTGGAVANGFFGVPGVKVHVLYPSGLVSTLQEKQFSTLGGNIAAVEVKGSFDECQRLVKEAFMDLELRHSMILTSANSINLARFLPQSFYYFHAWAQMTLNTRLVFSVPSGNYGNLTAGLMAREMGLPVHKFLSANNLNDVVPKYLLTGNFQPRPSTPTNANAMDVGDPSNFARMLDLFEHNHKWMTTHIEGYSFSDYEIRNIIRKVHQESGYLCDPHGATGYQAARSFLDAHSGFTGIFLETAHPAKFREIVEEVIGEPVEVPERLEKYIMRNKQSVMINPAYADFKEYLSSHC
jgi:threonine synthase